MTRKLIACFGLACASTITSTGWAQTVATSELYGMGVHHYFSRNYSESEQLLTRAIDAGSLDPRAYYYRGLARECFGGGGEIDFEEGARLEAAGRSGPEVSYSLARIQGHARVKIEKARRDARLQAAIQRSLQQQSQMQAPALVPTPLPGTIPGQNPVAPLPGTSDPFAPGEGVRSPETRPAMPGPTTPSTDASTDPFKDETSPAPADPFGASPMPNKPQAEVDPFSTAPATPANSAGLDPFAQ